MLFRFLLNNLRLQAHVKRFQTLPLFFLFLDLRFISFNFLQERTPIFHASLSALPSLFIWFENSAELHVTIFELSHEFLVRCIVLCTHPCLVFLTLNSHICSYFKVDICQFWY